MDLPINMYSSSLLATVVWKNMKSQNNFSKTETNGVDDIISHRSTTVDGDMQLPSPCVSRLMGQSSATTTTTDIRRLNWKSTIEIHNTHTQKPSRTASLAA
jgi:hypothetical protein